MVAEQQNNHGDDVQDRSKADWQQECEKFMNGMKLLQESSRTQGVIPQLRPHFVSLNQKGKTSLAYLCSPDTDHVSTGLTDLGWGCGYRNCQMLMTFLSKQRDRNGPIIDGIVNIDGLQLLLEKAWKEGMEWNGINSRECRVKGFDPEGAGQLAHRVHKTRKWIGTTEVFTMLAYLGIRCTILDFDRPTGAGNSHDAMFDWVQSYFEESIETSSENEDKAIGTDAFQQLMSNAKQPIVRITSRPPIYLQHAGHSRTIVGIEILSDGRRNLIMFDPGRQIARCYKRNISMPEDDMCNSGLLSVNNDGGDVNPEEVNNDETQATTGIFSKVQQWMTVPPSNLLRPFRVDSKTISKNRQYQLLVLGEVKEIKNEKTTGKQRFCWTPNQSFRLTSKEREQHKRIGSYRVV